MWYAAEEAWNFRWIEQSRPSLALVRILLEYTIQLRKWFNLLLNAKLFFIYHFVSVMKVMFSKHIIYYKMFDWDNLYIFFLCMNWWILIWNFSILIFLQLFTLSPSGNFNGWHWWASLIIVWNYCRKLSGFRSILFDLIVWDQQTNTLRRYHVFR